MRGITIMTTKPFPNSFGKEIQLTRDEFIQRWIEPTHQFAYILGAEGSLDKLNELQAEIIRLAGKKWDNQ
jgi:hypothetical protein